MPPLADHPGGMKATTEFSQSMMSNNEFVLGFYIASALGSLLRLCLFCNKRSCLYLKCFYSVHCFLCHHHSTCYGIVFSPAPKTVPQVQRFGRAATGVAAVVVPTDQAPRQTTSSTLWANPSDLRRRVAQSEVTEVGTLLPLCILTDVSHDTFVYISPYFYRVFCVVSDSPPVKGANHWQCLLPLGKTKTC